MPWTVDSPRPLPSPGCLVVKKGSNTRLRVEESIPWPVSDTTSSTKSPAISRHETWNLPRRHRVARVGREVQHHLLDVPRIGHDGAGAEVELELDALAEQALEQHRAVRHHPPTSMGRDCSTSRRANARAAREAGAARAHGPELLADLAHLGIVRATRMSRGCRWR
jgi:hypothetical protein